MINPDYDLIIVGSGVAGLTAALESGNNRVLIVTKTDKFSSGSSPLAQGGIAAPVGSDDSPELHYNDTIKAGAYSGLSNQISFLTSNGIGAIEDLIKFNMAFDKNEDGLLDRNQEGAHSRRRVLKAGGDSTGRILVETLYNQAIQRSNITWQENLFVYDLIINNNFVNGIIAYSKNDGWLKITAPCVLLATGGLGQLFGHTTNPIEATGDAMALAVRSGIRLKEIEMVQFHPTALKVGNGESLMLLTEALRGDGAVLVKEDGTPFMGKYSPLKELAPRDVVSRAIWYEMELGNDIFIDLRPIHDISSKFPTVTSFCLKAGLNPQFDLIPITPAVHYVMGGIDINSSLPTGLGVAGEASYTGVHGANRLASNSLLECLVYGKSEVHRILKLKHEISLPETDFLDLNNIPDISTINLKRKELQNIMYNYCGIIRNEPKLLLGQEKLKELEYTINNITSSNENFTYSQVVKWLELKNMLTVGKSLIDSALYRKESRGAHYREDYPETSIKWDRIKILGDNNA